MADKYDAFRVAQRLLTMGHIRKTIAGYEVSSGNMSLSEVDNALVELNSLKETVDQYISEGDPSAFFVSKKIGDMMSEFRRWKFSAQAKKPKRKSVYIGDFSTLQFIAEDELGDAGQWPRLLFANGIRYSTGIINLNILDIPQ